ncbi:MAG: hypothetical protein QW343_01225, partial [Candidatus Norongarragalinales archaeon]
EKLAKGRIVLFLRKKPKMIGGTVAAQGLRLNATPKQIEEEYAKGHHVFLVNNDGSLESARGLRDIAEAAKGKGLCS